MGVAGGLQLTEPANAHVVLQAPRVGTLKLLQLSVSSVVLRIPVGRRPVLSSFYCVDGLVATDFIQDSILRFGGSCSMDLEWPEETKRSPFPSSWLQN